MFNTIWSQFIQPILRRPARYQVAALCYRRTEGRFEILLVTSRETRRWILPKGWPKKGFGASGTAREEAWEEAGVTPRGTSPRHIGRYSYDKRMTGGVPVPTNVDVYAIETETLSDAFPEADERDRRWVTPVEAAEMVQEEDLSDLILKAQSLVDDPSAH